eukprot:g551.t1
MPGRITQEANRDGPVSLKREFVAHTKFVSCLHIGRRSKRVLVTGGEDNRVNIWRIGKPGNILSLQALQSSVRSVKFDQNEQNVAAGSSGGSIKLLNLSAGGKVARAFTGHRSECLSVDFGPFGKYLASASQDTNVKIWDIRRKDCIETYRGHSGRVTKVIFSPDGRWLASGSDDGTAKIWDLKAGKLLHNFHTHRGAITAMNFHPTDFIFLTAAKDRKLKLWDLEDFSIIASSGAISSAPMIGAFSTEGERYLTAAADSLRVWQVDPLSSLGSTDVAWHSHNGKLGDMVAHSDGSATVCAMDQSFVSTWTVNVDRIVSGKSDIVEEVDDLYEEDFEIDGKEEEEEEEEEEDKRKTHQQKTQSPKSRGGEDKHHQRRKNMKSPIVTDDENRKRIRDIRKMKQERKNQLSRRTLDFQVKVKEKEKNNTNRGTGNAITDRSGGYFEQKYDTKPSPKKITTPGNERVRNHKLVSQMKKRDQRANRINTHTRGSSARESDNIVMEMRGNSIIRKSSPGTTRSHHSPTTTTTRTDNSTNSSSTTVSRMNPDTKMRRNGNESHRDIPSVDTLIADIVKTNEQFSTSGRHRSIETGMGGSFKAYVNGGSSGASNIISPRKEEKEQKEEPKPMSGLETLQNAIRADQGHLFEVLVSRKRELNVINSLWQR